MKWFQHLSSAYTDIALKDIIAEYGMEGYGFYWICCELIAQQGKNYRFSNKLKWKKTLNLVSTLSEPKIDELLQRFAELNLISKKAFNNGALSIPKMKNYSDNYTKYPQRYFKATSKLLLEDKNRIDKIRKEEKKKPFFNNLPLIKKKDGTWWVIHGIGDWREFCGESSKIEWR